MGAYTKKGLYNGYDKNNKARADLDYYSTPPKEVLNILETLDIDLNDKVILEPCAGGGHMVQGIETYCNQRGMKPAKLIKTDIKDRGCPGCETGTEFDFFSDDYPYDKADVLIMNPPFSCIEGFMIRALEIAPVVIMLGRTQVLEGQSRYKNVLKDNPPSDIYQYIDRIACWKNGIEPTGASAQAYAWVVWDKSKSDTKFHWIWRK